MAEEENSIPQAPAQAGQVISPGAPVAPPPHSVAAPETTVPPQAAPSQQQPSADPQLSTKQTTTTETVNPLTEDPEPSPYQIDAMPAASDDITVQWSASEFIAHEKSAAWYVKLTGAALFAAAIVYLLTRDKISAVVILVGAFFLGFYAGRQPKQLDYRVDVHGVQIGQKFYAFSDFRSFAIVPEGAFSSIVFVPLKRFAPLLTIYYAPDDEEKIINAISQSLPIEERGQDAVDNLMRRIRF